MRELQSTQLRLSSHADAVITSDGKYQCHLNRYILQV
jgi:hypothetical protein